MPPILKVNLIMFFLIFTSCFSQNKNFETQDYLNFGRTSTNTGHIILLGTEIPYFCMKKASVKPLTNCFFCKF